MYNIIQGGLKLIKEVNYIQMKRNESPLVKLFIGTSNQQWWPVVTGGVL